MRRHLSGAGYDKHLIVLRKQTRHLRVKNTDEDLQHLEMTAL